MHILSETKGNKGWYLYLPLLHCIENFFSLHSFKHTSTKPRAFLTKLNSR